MNSILPRASTWLFTREETGTITFSGEEIQDDKWVETQTGYISVASGDSGSGHWHTVDYRKNKNANVEARNVLIAITKGGMNTSEVPGDPNKAVSSFIEGKYFQCRNIGTKVSEDIVSWLMKMIEKSNK